MFNKKVIVFIGPSLSVEERQEILDADYRPPVKRDDILSAIDENPDIIGIVDGVFHQSPAVSHKEILKAIDNQITVVGGSSMGALRAAELDDLGMIGVGYIYQQYANGSIESDDDVALVFTSDDYTPLSVPYVNIEYNLNQAGKKKIITSNEKKQILKVAKSLYYPKRNYPSILEKVDMDLKTKSRLKEFLKTGVDIKKYDAIEVLKYINNLVNG
ncbi:MAG: TfuA-related McrA-glycine thioamidation protein [Methanobrevibacter sp.]|jgi:hypothetical protein|nr:TfuA-related McrA-glycine thioamidation protein [Candidatus Methanovirga basalitermitum]